MRYFLIACIIITVTAHAADNEYDTLTPLEILEARLAQQKPGTEIPLFRTTYCEIIMHENNFPLFVVRLDAKIENLPPITDEQQDITAQLMQLPEGTLIRVPPNVFIKSSDRGDILTIVDESDDDPDDAQWCTVL